MVAASQGQAVPVPGALTEYVVLGQDNSGFWSEVKTVEARDPKAAVKAFVSQNIEAFDLYVAVPSRSWNPVTVAKKIETTFVIEDAK